MANKRFKPPIVVRLIGTRSEEVPEIFKDVGVTVFGNPFELAVAVSSE